MDTLLANFRSIYSGDYHEDCKAMAQTCDELHHLLVFVHRLASSLADPREAPRSQSIDLSNPFSNAVRDLAALASERPTSSLGVGRGSRRLTSSTSHSPIPSFSCRQFNPTATTKPKVGLRQSTNVDGHRLASRCAHCVMNHSASKTMPCTNW